eukprot:Blabericola_migrator_1__2709@NODE_1770_length_3820_cov_171_504929_g1142_i0_p3_GENE_NODE_1770_length_3820_cov_171_504929_g1142_i0NODE_1770_length_3820_cov_171_504929_g1142_i0_p3_ORF_typecomplete_len173_score12_48Ferlin_C/PF16165_5/0_44Ferlin_C/PF16165_5/1_1e02_NODE_1770_length_3820_cov_171_504929_g1142_i021072625
MIRVNLDCPNFSGKQNPTQETDVHYHSRNGNAIFNYRMVYSQISTPVKSCLLQMQALHFQPLSAAQTEASGRPVGLGHDDPNRDPQLVVPLAGRSWSDFLHSGSGTTNFAGWWMKVSDESIIMCVNCESKRAPSHTFKKGIYLHSQFRFILCGFLFIILFILSFIRPGLFWQ